MIQLTRKNIMIGASALSLLLIVVIVVTAVIVSSRHTDNAQTASSEDSSASSSLQVGNAQTSPEETLASLKANTDYQNPHTDIPYDELFRNSDKYKGQYVHYTGEVIQVLGEPGNWNLRVNITKDTIGSYTSYTDTVLIFSYSQERVIEKDIIDFTAIANGVYTYQSTFGSDITVPSLTIYEQTVVGRNDY